MPAPARNKLSATDLCDKARWHATRPKRFPYLAKALWAITIIETDKVETMGIDEHWRVYVNPAHVFECNAESFDTVIVGMLHECLHGAKRHGSRARAIQVTDHHRWNQCADCDLVQDIIDGAPDLKLWSKDITPAKMGWPERLAAEEYYKLPQKGQQAGKPQGMAFKPCSGGSATNGVKQPWELPAPGEAGFEKGKTPPGLNEAEQAIVRVATAHAILEAVAKGRGSVPSGMVRWAQEIIAPPPIDWDQAFAGRAAYYLNNRRGPVASYARPNRRQLRGGLILPIHRNPEPKIGVVGDTSGSMGKRDIAKVEGLMWSGIEAKGRVWAVGCDSAATEPKECRHLEDLREVIRGGGGTDMGAGLYAIEAINPDLVVVCTDGDTGWPAEAPPFPVIIVLTRKTSCPLPAWATDVIDASDCHARDDEEIP